MKQRVAVPLLIGLCLPLLLLGCQSSKSHAGPLTFRVMTYNIHHGEGLDKKVDLQRIADLIKRERADIVALQEVDKGVERTARRDFPAELAALTGMTCFFSNNYHFQGGEYGNAILTRFPVKAWSNTHYRMLRPGEQRGMLQVRLILGGRDILFVDTHIDYRPDDAERLINADELLELAARNRGTPVVLCGDFNDTPGSRTHAKLAAAFHDTWERIGQGDGFTIPARSPVKRIDYIWVSKEAALTPLKIWVPHSEASDHLPVVAEFRF
jgi:endonuclease/exonuclease/phosphatase family metal-dependent hydrolase